MTAIPIETGGANWRRTCLPAGSTLRDAIENLDNSAMQIVLVVGANDTLIGTVTDGDVRRGLLRGLALDAPVDDIMAREPLVAPQDIGRETVLQLMQMNRIHQLPVINEQRQVVGLHLWNELFPSTERQNLVVIMAGGRGARLLPITETCPKPLLPVSGKPILQHIIERARGEGFTRFALAVHYLAGMIEEQFGNGSQLQVAIHYLKEDAPQGTAGALQLLKPRPTLPVVVTNGDVLTDINFGELLDFHTHHRAMATMAVRVHEWQNPFGVVQTAGVDIVGFDEKPVSRTHINAGIYVIDPAVLDHLTGDAPVDMPELFARVQKAGGRTVAFLIHEPWLDVGRLSDLAKAQQLKDRNSSSDT